MDNQLIANKIASVISLKRDIKSAIDIIDEIFNQYGNPSIEIVNYLKSIVQKEALESWKKNNYRGIIAIATGTGKSRIPINYLNEIMKSTILVVPTEKLRDQNWKEEFEKVQELEIYNNIHRECYASLKNIKDRSWRLAILDEVHSISELNSTFFDNNVIHQIMGLTATVPTDPIKLKILEELNLPIVYSLTLDEAVKLRLVAPYEITIIETELDNDYKYIKSGGKFKITEKQSYDKINAVINKLKRRINTTVINTNGYGFADDNSNKVLSPKEKKLLDTMIMKRMKLIYGSYSKLQCAKWLTHLFDTTKRYIYFCGTIEQANEISLWQYHSKSKNDKDLQEFINGTIDELSCVNSLNEGMNIPNVDCAVILQCNSNELHTIQRINETCPL